MKPVFIEIIDVAKHIHYANNSDKLLCGNNPFDPINVDYSRADGICYECSRKRKDILGHYEKGLKQALNNAEYEYNKAYNAPHN